MAEVAQMDRVSVEPMDEHNQVLVDNVHPAGWTNPEPEPMYNIVVVGAGTAGLVTSIVAAGMGAKVALVERHLMGGDCLNVGCVPSKCIISSARVAETIRDAARYGVRISGEPEIDFQEVMARMRKLRAHISHHDSAKRFTENGVDVFLGEASFTGRNTIQVGDKTLRFKKAAITTGARAGLPPVEGLEAAGYLTNETLFTLTAQPARLGVIGSGPIGCEMAQTFQRLGTEVTVFEKAQQILTREDRDAARVVEGRMKMDGVRFLFNCDVKRVERNSDELLVHATVDGKEECVAVDEILVAAGRQPNVETLDLEKAGVDYDKRSGVKVNDFLQTSNPNIYGAGDVCMAWKFTHAAEFAAQIVIQNALFSIGPFGRRRLSSLNMPWCTYTEPELAHVGLSDHEARERGIEVDTYVQDMEEVDRAIAESDTDGFVKIHVKKGTDQILGATIVARNAGDMISEVSVAMGNGVGLKGIGDTIHPYPTQAEAIRKVAMQYRKSTFTPALQKWVSRWMAFRR